MYMIFLSLLLSLSLSSLFAQYSVSGSVVSAESSQPVEMAAVRVFAPVDNVWSDSVMVTGAQTDYDGKFQIASLKNGNYRLVISSVGFKEHSVSITVRDKDLSLKTIRLQEMVQHLGEVEITGKAAEMTVKGDTLEYNTAAYKVSENATVEELLKKMSGVEVDKEGNVTVNGESIKGIRIDGKKFFGDDVQAATKNIPAEMIDKIQVIDEKSDMAKLTGFEDDDTERIINLRLKEDRKKGLFSNITGGLGADMLADNNKWFDYNKNFMSEDFRYNGSLFMNILSGESQTTIIGGANNTNQLRTGRGRGFWAQDNSGITWAENIGVNTNIAGKNGWVFGGDAQFTHSYNDTRTKSEKEQWTDEFTYNQNDSSSKISNTWDVRTRLEFEWKIDTLNSLIIKPEISYSNSRNNTYRAYDYFTNGDTTTIGLQNNTGLTKEIGANLRLIYSHKFLKPGRTLTLNAYTTFSNSVGDSHNKSDNISYTETSIAPVNQWTDKLQNSLTYRLRTSYVEPIYKTNHFIETVLTFAGTNRWSTKNQFADSARTNLDTEYSNSLKSIFFDESLELNYRWVKQSFDFTAGVRFNPSQTLSTTTYGNGLLRDTMISVFNVSPNVTFRYNFGKKEFARIRYRGRTNQPTITQMEPVKDNSNAMNERVGNLNLVPAFAHTLHLMYSKYNQDKMSSIMTGLHGTLTKDALVNNSIYDETGKLYQQTVNAQALPWSLSGDFMFNTPFANKLMQFHTRTSLSYNQCIAYISRETTAAQIASMIENNTWMLGSESRTGNLRASEELTLRLTHKIVDVGAKGTFTYSRTQNNLNAASLSNVFNWSVTGDLTFHLPKSWEIATDIGYTARYGYKLSDVNELMWNASVTKSWGAASLALNVYDILNQKKNIVQVVGENYVQYQKFNSLPTYFMLTFSYRLNRMGDMKAKGRAAFMQEMVEGGSKPNRIPQGPPPMFR
ncbi:MAG: TonB-dependent receptor [Paludibacteraceae bacterium]|nr:TonB-dependent receptor [Paludibacteraceae bacterium]